MGEVKARIWPGLAYLIHVCSRAGGSPREFDAHGSCVVGAHVVESGKDIGQDKPASGWELEPL